MFHFFTPLTWETKGGKVPSYSFVIKYRVHNDLRSDVGHGYELSTLRALLAQREREDRLEEVRFWRAEESTPRTLREAEEEMLQLPPLAPEHADPERD